MGMLSSKMKKMAALILVLVLAAGLFGCGVAAQPHSAQAAASGGPPQRVVALSSSLAELWLLAGGELAGTTSDTLERGFEARPEDMAVVGSVKEPSLEAILALEPDYVIYSSDLSGHASLEQALNDAGIAHYAAHVETFEDYLAALEHFTGLTGHPELYTQNGTAVREEIDALMAAYTPATPRPSYLLMRVHSSGGKVIADDHVACDILKELGAVNIATENQSLLSDFSLEAIMEAQPSHIFIVTMGDETAALQTLEQVFTAQPAWQKLSAVQSGRVHLLPKELFHYKPNAKWGEAYEALIERLAG